MGADPITPLSTGPQVEVLLKDRADEVRRFGVARIGIFGSFARGTQTAASDIDILVEFLPGQKTFDNFMRLSLFLEDAAGRTVELVTPESLSEDILHRIRHEAAFVALPS